MKSVIAALALGAAGANAFVAPSAGLTRVVATSRSGSQVNFYSMAHVCPLCSLMPVETVGSATSLHAWYALQVAYVSMTLDRTQYKRAAAHIMIPSSR